MTEASAGGEWQNSRADAVFSGQANAGQAAEIPAKAGGKTEADKATEAVAETSDRGNDAAVPETTAPKAQNSAPAAAKEQQ